METLKRGDRGYPVKSLQRKLQLLEFDLTDDGILGPGTEDLIRQFQKDNQLSADGVVGPRTWRTLLEKAYSFTPLQVDWDRSLNPGRFLPEIQDKRAIYLHHTAGRYNPQGVLDWWNQDPSRVATAFIIGRRKDTGGDEAFNGKSMRAFDEKHWAYHLGLHTENNDSLNATSIGIEICNLGPLERKGGGFVKIWRDRRGHIIQELPIPGHEVRILDKPWRGHAFFHAYTAEQLAECERLVLSLAKLFHIPLSDLPYSPDWFDINPEALNGKPGLWTHANVRNDKTDCYPDPHLIEMLNGLHEKSLDFEVETSRSVLEKPFPDEPLDDLRYYFEPLEE